MVFYHKFPEKEGILALLKRRTLRSINSKTCKNGKVIGTNFRFIKFRVRYGEEICRKVSEKGQYVNIKSPYGALLLSVK